MKDITKLVRANIAALKPYSTARDEYKGELGVLLDANENPNDNGLNRYPSTALKERLRARVAALKGVAHQRLFLGNGSDEAIDLCYRVFCEPGRDNAVIIAPSYGMYSVCADINNVERRMVQLEPETFALPVDRLLAAVDSGTKLMFVCSPNNPTANAFPASDIERLAAGFDGILVVDEAYIDFSGRPGALPLLDKYQNIIVLQTLSKAYGMAGLRVGLAMASPYIISLFRQVKYPYNIGTDTIAVALEQLEKGGVASQVAEIIAERDRLSELLPCYRCVQKVWPSDANFLLVRCTDPRGLYDALLAAGVIVRDRSGVKGCEGCLRITVGTPAENKKLLKAIEAYES
ncbi:MAG: histidinol-phosphate transaminase [Bacteroidales bacterium]|nr:histidinol-phosphate transaminase [Bacteroidales bacterium]